VNWAGNTLAQQPDGDFLFALFELPPFATKDEMQTAIEVWEVGAPVEGGSLLDPLWRYWKKQGPRDDSPRATAAYDYVCRTMEG
jgi:hypothetical protein